MADVERTCDRIIVLQGGQLVHSGEVAQFTKETETVFIEVDTQSRSTRDGARAARRRRDRRTAAGLTIEGPDESVYDHVRDALVEAQAPLRRMAPRRRALTELFERDGAHDACTRHRLRHRLSALHRRARRSRPRRGAPSSRMACGSRSAWAAAARAKILPWFFIGVLSVIGLVMALDRRRGGPTRRARHGGDG